MRSSLTVTERLRLTPVRRREHLLFNLLNFVYFRKRDYSRGFSIESNPFFTFTVVPYTVFSEVYFFRQARYFAKLEQQVVGVLALEGRIGTLYVSSLAVSPFFRRNGVATFLLNRATALARQLGLGGLELSVNKRNTPALKLYERYGFRKKAEGFNSYVLRKDLEEH